MQDPHFEERLNLDTPDWGQHSAYHVARYLFAADHVQGKRVLDAGTGFGYGALILKTAGASEVQAVDLDPAAVKVARERFARDGLEYLVNNCEQLANVHGPFDVICNFENIEHLHHPEAFLANAARLLKDDGVFFCSTPDRGVVSEGAEKPSNPYHIKEWYISEFRSLLSPYFEDVNVRIQIENLSVARLREVRDQLIQHLIYLWATPLVRVSRALGRLFGQKPPAWDGLYYLPAPTRPPSRSSASRSLPSWARPWSTTPSAGSPAASETRFRGNRGSPLPTATIAAPDHRRRPDCRGQAKRDRGLSRVNLGGYQAPGVNFRSTIRRPRAFGVLFDG